MKQLEEKVRRLETPSMDTSTEENNSISNAVIQKSIHRTCHEVRTAGPSLTSGKYWIDPDGQGVGDDPINVFCDMSKGKIKP